MRRLASALALGFLLALALAPAHAQDDDAKPTGDDANPYKLSDDELEATKKFSELENYAIRSLQERDFEGAERRYKKLLVKLEADELLNEPTKRLKLAFAHYNLACNYSLNKQTKEALAEFEKSCALGYWGWKHIKKDTDLDNIRDEDEYHAIVKKWKRAEAKSFDDEEERLIAQVTSLATTKKNLVKGYDFSVTASNGDELEKGQLRGKVVVISIFHLYDEEGAPAEVEALVKLHHEYKKKGVVVLGVAPVAGGDVSQWLQKFSDDNDVKYPLAGVRPADPVLEPYNKTFGETRLVFLDKRGKVKGVAKKLKSYETLEKVVQVLLDQPAPEK